MSKSTTRKILELTQRTPNRIARDLNDSGVNMLYKGSLQRSTPVVPFDIQQSTSFPSSDIVIMGFNPGENKADQKTGKPQAPGDDTFFTLGPLKKGNKFTGTLNKIFNTIKAQPHLKTSIFSKLELTSTPLFQALYWSSPTAKHLIDRYRDWFKEAIGGDKVGDEDKMIIPAGQPRIAMRADEKAGTGDFGKITKQQLVVQNTTAKELGKDFFAAAVKFCLRMNSIFLRRAKPKVIFMTLRKKDMEDAGETSILTMIKNHFGVSLKPDAQIRKERNKNKVLQTSLEVYNVGSKQKWFILKHVSTPGDFAWSDEEIEEVSKVIATQLNEVF
tara:strand:+ start:68 stop:1057 length:990 start_codon:yes stop_codon:yes gene_type:complete